MKKIILLFLSSFFGYSQVYIEVKLVNENIGHPVYNQNINQTISNDAGLNTILAANNVTTYELKGGDPFGNPNKYMNIYNGSNDFSNTTLLTQLQNYSSVIESATFCSNAYFSNKLLIQLVTNSTGQQNGTNGNIVVTNDIGLNQIFQQHNIVQMFQAFTSNSLNRYYYIRSSNCNLQNLKTALQNYAAVIQTVDYVSAAYLLNNDTFNKNKTLIYPNPFQNELKIETIKTITVYKLIDISGKIIADCTSKIDFDNYISNLNDGLYFLQLNYDDNTNSSHKIIKN
jgi:hypothetical protein